MQKISKGIVRMRHIILLIAIALLIPSAIGYINTRVNYDVLSYLPEDIETMKGQDILAEDFGTGAFSMCVVEGMELKDVARLKEKIEAVDHVREAIWYDSFADLSIPVDILPDELKDAFINGDATMMVVLFDTTMSSDETMEAITQIRRVTQRQAFISGMSAVVTDTRDLSDSETPIYVAIAVALSALVLSITMDSFLVPVFFLLSIGMAVVYNLGCNIFLGQISYITKALAAVLQLGVTMDYSIFLWHSYKEQQLLTPGDKKQAMANAITATFTSVIGSSVTTVAGFIALCFMSFTLGLDMGVVMAKGVIFGVICCVTVLPSMILIFDRAIEKTSHKPLLPNLNVISEWVTKHYVIFAILFVIIWIPAIIGYKNTEVYYNLDSTLPETLDSIVANKKLEETFEMNATHVLLADSSLDDKSMREMLDEIGDVAGVKSVIGLDSFVGPMIPKDFIPNDIKEKLDNGTYQMIMIMSEYKVASDEVNAQVDEINAIMDKYDRTAMLIGEAPCTKDLINITDKDFKTVSAVSIGAIFVIILLVFKSVSLPILLVAVIEFGIFINLGIPYYTGTKLPFIASIVIGTIQLGATVDYAILMTNRYKIERYAGADKKEAITSAHKASIQSVIVSALSFFAATFGVGLYSNIDMISSLCTLMARGALISMTVVIFVLPSVFMIFDGLIIRTSKGFRVKSSRTETGSTHSGKIATA